MAVVSCERRNYVELVWMKSKLQQQEVPLPG